MIRHHITTLLGSTALWAAPDDTNAGGKAPLGQHKTSEVDTSKSSGFSGTLEIGEHGNEMNVSETESTTDHIEVGNGTEAEKPVPDAGDEDHPADKEDAGEDTDKEEAGDEEAPTVTGEVPDEFKADDPETVAAFDKALRNADGKLNMDALSAQWWANAQAHEKGEGALTQSTYDYLDSLGIPPEMVKAAEAGQQALNTQSVQSLYTAAGGKANYDTAIAWASKGDKPAYTPAQKDAFNRALDKGGETAKDAIDLLMSRHEKATSGKHTSPGKTAGEHANGGGSDEVHGADVFGSREEWIKARQEAGRDSTKQQAVSDKYRRSPNAGKW